MFGELLALPSVTAVRKKELYEHKAHDTYYTFSPVTPVFLILFSLFIMHISSILSQLCDTEHGRALKTLELFAYGKWGNYRDSRTKSEPTYIDLNDAQSVKLKQLTIVALAEQNKVIDMHS